MILGGRSSFFLDFLTVSSTFSGMDTQKNAQNSSKKVLITGCSSGFGLLTAVRAAQAGYEVVATMRNLQKAEPLKRGLADAGVSARIEKLDVTSPESISEVVEKAGPVDILINNAGILITGSFLDITDEEMRRVFETNYFGVVNLTRAVTAGMIQRRTGRIINIASLAGLIGHPFNAAYGASKHAIIGFTKSIRVELAPFGIDVVSVEPGYHKTEIIRANANQSVNFYDRSSPMFEWNRGFLKAFMDEIIPRADKPEPVVETIFKAMTAQTPKAHYVIGKDAKGAILVQWLGLFGWLERKIGRKIRRARKVENAREAEKRARRKQKKSSG